MNTAMKIEDGATIEGVDMDAINAAIGMAMGAATVMESVPAVADVASEIAALMAAEASPVISTTAEAVAAVKSSRKASAVFTVDGIVTSKVGKAPKAARESKAPKDPNAPKVARAANHPALSPTFGTPILGVAADKCTACATIVKWFKTTDTTGTNVWECSICSRIAPRGVRAKTA